MLHSSPDDADPASDNILEHKEALDSLGIVVGEIAHDFNNILSVIFGYVEMALSELPEGARARSDLEHVLAAGDRANDFVERILTFSQSTKLDRSPISLEGPIRDAIEYQSVRLPLNVHLTSRLDDDKLGHVLANSAEVYRIVRNLCTNSVQAMPEKGGVIELALDYVSADAEMVKSHAGLSCVDYARIIVSDTGSGMDIDTLGDIYTPFYSTSRSDSAGKKRAGLGLTTVLNIVDYYGGRIFVDSEPGIGTKFEVFLPLVEAEVNDDVSVTSEPEKDFVGKHVLLIDDEEPILTMARKMLEINGHTVTSLADGNIALEYFRQQPHLFDVVITDLIMPSISGTELASKISAINPNVPIILSTGFSQKITEEACSQWGISTVINKPFSIKELLAAVEF